MRMSWYSLCYHFLTFSSQLSLIKISLLFIFNLISNSSHINTYKQWPSFLLSRQIVCLWLRTLAAIQTYLNLNIINVLFPRLVLKFYNCCNYSKRRPLVTSVTNTRFKFSTCINRTRTIFQIIFLCFANDYSVQFVRELFSALTSRKKLPLQQAVIDFELALI